jgi:anaphase-promoting complex subunit 4
LASTTKSKRPGEELDETDDSNVNSVLFVSSAASGTSGDQAHVYAWLDGSYPLGAVPLPTPLASVVDMHKLDNAAYALYVRFGAALQQRTALAPLRLELPLLTTPRPRHVALAASSTRALVWYTLRLVREMREAWFGSGAHQGAREIGPNWVRALEARQATQFGGTYSSQPEETLVQC